jgi:hypothetical protein
MPRDEKTSNAGDDPLDAFRNDDPDLDEDLEGQEALGRPQDLKPGQRRVVEDD